MIRSNLLQFFLFRSSFSSAALRIRLSLYFNYTNDGGSGDYRSSVFWKWRQQKMIFSYFRVSTTINTRQRPCKHTDTHSHAAGESTLPRTKSPIMALTRCFFFMFSFIFLFHLTYCWVWISHHINSIFYENKNSRTRHGTIGGERQRWQRNGVARRSCAYFFDPFKFVCALYIHFLLNDYTQRAHNCDCVRLIFYLVYIVCECLDLLYWSVLLLPRCGVPDVHVTTRNYLTMAMTLTHTHTHTQSRAHSRILARGRARVIWHAGHRFVSRHAHTTTFQNK